MARLRALVVALAALLLGSASANAASLQRLTVTQLTLSADTAQPHLEVPFHLTVTAHVREKVEAIENVDLPILAEVELLGDEHSVVSGPDGTTYRERIAVVAHHTGSIAIAPVTLDAIDPRDGRAKRYSSNPLTIVVAGGALVPQAPHAPASWPWLVAVALAIALIVLLARARRRRPAATTVSPPEPVPPPVPAPPVRTRVDHLRDALAILRVEGTREQAVRVRHLVRGMVGASDAETLGDVLRRSDARDPQMAALLRALERAAFTTERDLHAAIVDVVVQLERMT